MAKIPTPREQFDAAIREYEQAIFQAYDEAIVDAARKRVWLASWNNAQRILRALRVLEECED